MVKASRCEREEHGFKSRQPPQGGKMNEEISKWDVSDIDPATMFPKDCRFYNGGRIAPAEIKRFWSQNSEESTEENKKPRKEMEK